MERIILSMVLAISLYQIDWPTKANPIWIVLYIVLSAIYALIIRKVNKIYGIKKSGLTKVNNFLIHIAFTVGLLIIIYGFKGASLWEWRLLQYSYIQYLVFIVFLIPFLLFFQVYSDRAYFERFKEKNIITAVYLFFPSYFYSASDILPKNNIEIRKVKLLAIGTSFALIIIYLWFYIIGWSYVKISSEQSNNSFKDAPRGLIRNVRSE